jgi:hypothetical protein
MATRLERSKILEVVTLRALEPGSIFVQSK